MRNGDFAAAVVEGADASFEVTELFFAAGIAATGAFVALSSRLRRPRGGGGDGRKPTPTAAAPSAHTAPAVATTKTRAPRLPVCAMGGGMYMKPPP